MHGLGLRMLKHRLDIGETRIKGIEFVNGGWSLVCKLCSFHTLLLPALENEFRSR
jgi:hypothetical protein